MASPLIWRARGFTFGVAKNNVLPLPVPCIKTRKVLIFDEANVVARLYLRKIRKDTLNDLAAKGKTIIVIAHRLSTVRDANKYCGVGRGQACRTRTARSAVCKTWRLCQIV